MAAGEHRTDALVLVNTASTSYADFTNYIKPYLDHFGVPYTIYDISSTTDPDLTANIGDYALIIVGHRELDAGNAYLDSTEQGYITSAVSGGTGLVNFDNELSADGLAARYSFINDIFTFGYLVNAPVDSRVTFPSTLTHYITAQHSPETITTGTITFLADVTLPGDVVAITTSGNQPFLAVTTSGTASGHAVQWGSYDWMSHAVKGPMFGLDDLVWRSLVWAARKPFVMQGLPPFVTMRMDDTSGPLWWIHTANDYGFIPWAGIFTNDIEEAEAIELKSLIDSGKATTNIHAFGTSSFFYFDHTNGANYSDTNLASNYTAATQWFADRQIPISKYLVPHYYEIGTNAFNGLQAWGTEFIGTMMDPGQLESLPTPWMKKGPFRLFDSGFAYQRDQNPYYADYLTIPEHPDLDGKFFNCVTEIRDITGYEWLGNGRIGVSTAIADGIELLKRPLDSMALATLFSHEYTFINSISQENWETIMQEITAGITSHNPEYVSMDYACQYLRAIHNSNISYGEYDTISKQVTTNFSATTDLATKFYIFYENGGQILDYLVDVPTGVTSVYFTLPGPLDHITVTPNPSTVIAGVNQQFTALGYDVDGTLIPNLVFSWQIVNGGGTIDASGLFTAGVTAGDYVDTVRASTGGIAGSGTIHVSETSLDHFSFDTISSPKFADYPFQLTIRARDIHENPVVSYSELAFLSHSHRHYHSVLNRRVHERVLDRCSDD